MVILDEIAPSADWVANALQQSGYAADFSMTSLHEVDRFFDDHSEQGQPRPDGLLAEQTGARLFALGAYVGEVIRRNHDGHWHVDDDDPKPELNVEVRLPEGTRLWPVQRMMNRLIDGPEAGVAFYATAASTRSTDVAGGPAPSLVAEVATRPKLTDALKRRAQATDAVSASG